MLQDYNLSLILEKKRIKSEGDRACEVPITMHIIKMVTRSMKRKPEGCVIEDIVETSGHSQNKAISI